MGKARLLAVGAASLVVLLTGCGDDETATSSADLKKTLPQKQALGVKAQRVFVSEGAGDFVGKGLVYSEATKASTLIRALDDAGLRKGAGVEFGNLDSERSPVVFVVAAAFDEESGARRARDTLHKEDLKQPCAKGCVVTPEEYSVKGVPDSAAAHHAPIPGKPPAGLNKFEAYLLEFTVGDRLYRVTVNSGPGRVSSSEFDRLAREVYEKASA